MLRLASFRAELLKGRAVISFVFVKNGIQLRAVMRKVLIRSLPRRIKSLV